MDPVDRELASLFSVEPSPEFRARVRARIASEPLPRLWHLQWRVAAAGAVTAVFVAGVAIMRVAPVQSPKPAPSLVESGQAPPVPAFDPAPTETPHLAPVTARRPQANNPEVVVDASAGRGLRQLDALVREGGTQFVLDDEAVLQESVRGIVVAPIVVEPITMTTLSEPAGDTEGD